ncbi:MAG: DUF169 domain-containing protein [Aigarchaeota archaeon]|nr:DUF169 domain-containing protein [Candidatus Pelearchaeum maunauluense]
MSKYARLSVELQTMLRLEKPPIAISFSPQAKQGLKESKDTVPSSCTFWAKALSETFYTTRGQHLNCSIGSVTHGIKKPDEVMPECGCGDVEMLINAGWITRDSITRLPQMPMNEGTISYGPSAHAPFDPDVVLVFCNAEQAMFIVEAVDSHKTMGKPTCAAIPESYNNNTLVVSLGCTASRLGSG